MRQAAARELVPEERVSVCLRRPVPGAAGVEMWRDPKHQAAHYKQLLVCGSVWMCAVCSAKVTERRREELSEAIRAWGGQIVLITCTLQHTAADGLVGLLEGLLLAARKLRQGKGWQKLEARYGLVGTIRALEVTDGRNGFHPHLHMLGFLAGGVDVEAFTRELRGRWLPAVAKVGRFASPVWGLDVRHADAEIADYVAKFGREPKWTVAHELAKQASKGAREDGRSMLQLLDAFALGDVEAGGRWREYARAFKGKHQLGWSPGLRALLLPDREEKTDEELANEAAEESQLLAVLDLAAWRAVLANDARWELLEVASSGDFGAIRRFLLSLGVQDKGVRDV